MKISILLNSGTRVAARRPNGADFVLIQKCPNPECGAAPCKVKGDGLVTHDNGYGAQNDTTPTESAPLRSAARTMSRSSTSE